MTPFDLVLGWILLELFGARDRGPRWPEPKSPTGPTGPTGQGIPPGTTGATGPTGPTGQPQTTWKPYLYVQPSAGEPLGTPYALAAAWHGQGTAWSELYNLTKGRPLGGASKLSAEQQKRAAGQAAKLQTEAARSTARSVLGAEDEPAGTDVSQKTPAYADVGDELLIPWTWPEPTHKAILARLKPIPAGTALPGVKSDVVVGDEDGSTI